MSADLATVIMLRTNYGDFPLPPRADKLVRQWPSYEMPGAIVEWEKAQHAKLDADFSAGVPIADMLLDDIAA